LSAALNEENQWNFRVLDKRLVNVKTKSEGLRKITILDVLTNLMFTVHASEAVDMAQLAPNGEYLFTINVYTSKNVSDVKEDYISFFEAVDIDQEMENFIKAYWVYPTKIRFELIEVEEA
jgi:hypothetical protein